MTKFIPWLHHERKAPQFPEGPIYLSCAGRLFSGGKLTRLDEKSFQISVINFASRLALDELTAFAGC
jgi:hypothetical protein